MSKDFGTKYAAKTRPYATDVSDATRTLENAIDNALDATGAESLFAEVDGHLYHIEACS